jgi:5-methylcytosine-specific restriction endonuclease McrA
MSGEYSKQQIISELKDLDKKLDGVVTSSDVDEHATFSYSVCYNYFESFSEAKRLAGIDVINAKDITDEEYLEELHRLKEELGRTPRVKDIKKHSRFSVQPYQSRWGSWNEAIESADMDVNHRTSGISDDELLGELRQLQEKLGKTPTGREIDEQSQFSRSTYRKRFGGIPNARKKAGLKPEIDTKNRVEFVCDYCGSVDERTPSSAQRVDYCSSACANKATHGVDAEDVITSLKEIAEDLGRTPSSQEFDQLSEYWHGTFNTIFGGYSQALRELGFETNAPKDISDNLLLETLREIHDAEDRIPKQSDLAEYGELNTADPYIRRWGSWANALAKAGLDPQTTQYKKIAKKDLVDEYQRVADEIGHPPSYTEIDEKARYCANTYERAFGSFLEAKDASGYDPIPTDNNPRGEDHYMWKGGKDITYGKNWLQQRKAALKRDEHSCQRCGMTQDQHIEKYQMELHVHHITPAAEFNSHNERNKLTNLLTVCASCHRKYEQLPVRPQVAQGGDS